MLNTDTLYVIQNEDTLYAWSPDGVGCYWYDTREEALADGGPVGNEVVFPNSNMFDMFRYGLGE